MGRTNPTFRNVLRRFEENWQQYRRALRREHQEDFDELLEHADRFAAAAGMQNPTDPEKAILVSVLLAHEVEQRELRERVENLEADE